MTYSQTKGFESYCFFLEHMKTYKHSDFFFLNLFMRDTEREKQAPCGEPSAGLNPGTPVSHPEPKADTQWLSHPGAPQRQDF